MPVLLILLLVGAFGYLFWKRKTTTLTRNCRWRRSASAGVWRCAFCGGELAQDETPKTCANPGRQG